MFFVTYALFAMLYAAGFAFAVAFWRRCRLASGLMLASTSILLAAVAVRALLHFHMLNGDINLANIDLVFTSLSLVQWLGHAVMIAAVFANRSRVASERPRRYSPYTEDDDWDDAPPAPQGDDTGLKDRNR